MPAHVVMMLRILTQYMYIYICICKYSEVNEAANEDTRKEEGAGGETHDWLAKEISNNQLKHILNMEKTRRNCSTHQQTIEKGENVQRQ